MKYHIKNSISKKELRKNGKNIIPLELMIDTAKCIVCDRLLKKGGYLVHSSYACESHLEDIYDIGRM